MFESLVAATAGTHGAGAVQAWARVESAACARRLAAMVGMLDTAYAASGSAERDQWCLDNWDAVGAHIAAAHRITTGTAHGFLLVAVALRDRFPKVAAVFADGLISYAVVRAIVTRSVNVVDPDAQRALDEALASALVQWEPMSVDKTEQTIDAFIAHVDPDAVRRTQTRARGRCVDVVIDDDSGLATLFASMFTPNAKAFDARVAALAATVCPADPRTVDQRRSDALGVLGASDRLACLCGTDDCPAGDIPPATGVVIYVVAHQDTITRPDAPSTPTPGAPAPVSPDHVDRLRDSDEPAPEDPPVGDEPADSESGPADTAFDYKADCAADECAGLDGDPPPMFDKPLRELTMTEALTSPGGFLSTIAPASLMGGQFLPGSIARRTAIGAIIRPIIHPGQAPPEHRYTPSRKLADFVRSRDLTCRFPGCKEPATNCDLDHTIPWPCGPTQASNLKCLCRRHHLLKTFWGGEGGWRDQQHPNGDVIWTAPDGRTYATTPGSRLLFPTLCEPTAPAVTTGTPTAHTTGLTMPRRQRTRAEDRTRRIHDERELNRAMADEEDAPPPSDASF